MAISYPLSTPTTIGIEQITLRAKNATATTESPFTYYQQVFQHSGARWEADVVIPSTRKDVSAAWVTMLIALKGQTGTFLLNDPDNTEIAGTATSMSITGSTGEDTVTVAAINGTILAGDYFQLGSGANSRLHRVLVTNDTGAATLEIWPPLRTSYSSASATLSNPKGVFRLASNVTEWSINNSSAYGISFSAVEDLTG